MYERILVPIDGGITAAQGLREAVKIAKGHGSLIRLIHVVDELPTVEPFGGSGGGELVMAQLRNIGESLLESSTGEVRDSSVPVDSELAGHLARMALFKVNTGTREHEVCGLKWSLECRSRRFSVVISITCQGRPLQLGTTKHNRAQLTPANLPH